MRITLFLLCLFLSGSVHADWLGKLRAEPQNNEEQFAIQVDQWADSKIQELLVETKGKLPMSINGEILWMDQDDASLFYGKFDAMNSEFQSEFVKHQRNMSKLRKTYDTAIVTLKDFTDTQALFETVIEKYASDFDDAMARNYRAGAQNYRAGSSNVELYYYCTSHDIEQSKCEANLANKVILIRHLLSAQPHYRKHLEWMQGEIKGINDFADKVAEHGIAFEAKLYFKRAASSGCKNVSDFDSNGLAMQIPYANFRPDSSLIYDLGHFKVLQSQADGVLLATTYPDSYNAPLIFSVTRKKYTDNYTFQPGEQRVCLSGTKEYISVLGVKKRVLSFRAIQDNNEYYFLMNEDRQEE